MGQLAKGTRGVTYSRVKDAGDSSYGQYEILQHPTRTKNYVFRPVGGDKSSATIVDFSRMSSQQVFDRCSAFDYDEQTIKGRITNNELDLVAEMMYNYTVKLTEREI